MAVQARHLSHAFFPHDLHAFRPTVDTTVAATAFLDEHGWSAPVAEGLGDFPRSELAWDYGFQQQPRKRPRVVAAAGCFVEEHSVALPQQVVPQQRGTRAAASGAASTSRGAINGDGLLSRLCRRHDAEIDALLTRESERMRAALEDARRRHAMALLATMQRAASGRLRAAEDELDRAARRNAELEEKARQVGAECEAWMNLARSHEAVAAGLRATLDDQLHLLQSQPPRAPASAGGCEEGGDAAEDARSCCFEAASAAAALCRSCGGGGACVLVLPCRHLCLCVSCEAAVDACPVCAAHKNASLRVLLS